MYHNKFLKHKTDKNWEAYRKQRNLVTKLKKTFINKGNNKITELRTILQRESQKLILVYKQTKSVNNRKTVKTVMTLTFLKEQQVVLNHPLSIQPLSPSYQIKV